MTSDAIKIANLIRMGFQCDKCDGIYDLNHPVDVQQNYWTLPIPKVSLDKCNGSKDYYTFRYRRIAMNYNLFKIQGCWFNVRRPLVDTFLKMGLIDEAMMGNISYPTPIYIRRQVDIFTAAEKLGLSSPLSKTQEKRAKSKAFVEKIKG